MRRLLPLLLAAPAAHAAVPLYNTDMIKAGEAMASFSASRVETRADTHYTPPANPFVTEPLAGPEETVNRSAGLLLTFGLRDDLNAYLAGTHTTADYTLVQTGRDVTMAPLVLQVDARQEGFEDLGAGLEYRLLARGPHVLVTRIDLDIPTASDYPGAPHLVQNGVTLSPFVEGRRGRGYTRYRPQFAGSSRFDATVLEWELAVLADDEKDTEAVYEAQVGVLQHLGSAAYLRLRAAAAWQQGLYNATLATRDVAAYNVTFTAGYFITPEVRLSASYGMGWADDATTTYTSGAVMAQGNVEQEAAGLAITYMLP